VKPSLSFDEVIDAGRPPLMEMQRLATAFGNSTTQEARTAVARQILFVEATVRQTYGQAAKLARKADTLDDAAEVWRRMGAFCDSALQALSDLKKRYPACDTAVLHDLILDYRNACETRQQRTLEDKPCLAMEFPKGLFPESS
jgi:hypothetical protein